jgi:hypothetical protein
VVLLHEEAAFLGLDGDEVHDAHVVGGCVGLHCYCVCVCASVILWRRLSTIGNGGFNFFWGA